MENFSLLLKVVSDSYFQKWDSELIIYRTQRLGGGCISNAFQLATNKGFLFLKWNSSGAATLFVTEAESLLELKATNNQYIQFPEPLLWREIDENPGFLLTTYLEQGSCGNDDEKLALGLAQLHRNSSVNFGFKTGNYCGATLQNNAFKTDWTTFYIENRIQFIVGLIREKRDWSAVDDVLTDQFLKRLPGLLCHSVKPSLIHGDLWLGNCMFCKKAPALIDPCVSYSDREMEWAMMLLFGGFSNNVFEVYQAEYPFEHGWKERLPVYQLYPILNHYYLFGGYYKEQALAIMKQYR